MHSFIISSMMLNIHIFYDGTIKQISQPRQYLNVAWTSRYLGGKNWIFENKAEFDSLAP